MLSDEDLKSLKNLLERQHKWPGSYIFKFIVPITQEKAVRVLFPSLEISTKTSRNGKYVSMTVKLENTKPDVIIAVYQKASQIPELISL